MINSNPINDYFTSKSHGFLPSPVSFPRASFISEQILTNSPRNSRRTKKSATSSQKKAIVQKLNAENLRMEKYFSWGSTEDEIFHLD